MADADDLSGAYVETVAARAQAGAAQQLLSRVRSRRGLIERAASQGAPGAPGARLQFNPAETRAGYAALAGDVGYGLTVDLPRAIAAGVRDAGQEVLDLTKLAGDWLDEHVVNLGSVHIPGTGEGDRPAELPDPRGVLGDTETVTGGIEKGIVQFLTGFKGAGKIVKGAGVAANTVKSAISSFAAFDGHEGNLANLWQQAGLPQNVLTDYLASSPDDSQIEGRFKNALADIGVNLGLIEGLNFAGRAMRTARVARQAPPVDEMGKAAALPQATARDFDVLGDVDQDKLIAKREPKGPDPLEKFRLKEKDGPADFGVPDDAAAKGLAKGKHEPEFFINWARIDEPDDVKNVMSQMADAFRPEVDAARRGKVTFEEIKLNAGQRNAWKDLAGRRQGDPLSAEAAVAARTLWASSSNKLAEVANLAASNPSETNLFAFRKMLEVHRTIQSEVIAARTETARALAAWRIPVTSDAIRHREISDLIAGAGGPETARELANRIAAASRGGRADVVEKLVDKGAGAKTVDAIREVWINGLLSGPQTHIVNTMSNTVVLAQQIGERAIAARVGQFLGGPDTVQLGEALEMWSALVDGSAKDGLRYAWELMRTGKDAFVLPGSKLDDARLPAVSAEAFGMDAGSWLGRGVDGIGNVVRTPSRALAAGDQFFKSIGYRTELRAQALRLAKDRVASGAVPQKMLQHEIEKILRDPPETVKLAAADQALYQTFNNKPGELATTLMRLKNRFPALNVLIPFVRTPANIFNYAAERSPMAPLFSRWRADISAGGARRDLAMTRMATGSLLMFAVADMALSGHITGGGPANQQTKDALRRSGWQPYSVKVGDSYVTYNRLDPVGLSMAMAADMVELLHNTEWDRRDTKTQEEIVYAAVGAIANSTMSKSYMEGMANLFTAMSDPRSGGAKRFFEQLAGSAVPAVAATAERTIDPWMREASGMIDAMRARTPGLSADLPPARDLWGRPKSYESGIGWAYDAFSPIYYRRENPEPIDREILKQGMSIQMPDRIQSFDGVPVDLDRHPGAYSRFLELAGNEVKHPAWGMGAKDFLNATVEGRSPLSEIYRMRSDGPDGGKEAWVKDQLSWYRKAARAQLLEEFPTLRAEVGDRTRRRRELSMRPTLQ